MKNKLGVLAQAALLVVSTVAGMAAQAANPIVPGWYADPEIRIFDGRYWIYPTYSDAAGKPEQPPSFNARQKRLRAQTQLIWEPFLKQTFLDAFSSPDLVHWTRHPHVLDVERVAWAAYAVWAPSAIEHHGRYYLFFGANDIKSNGQLGGIGVAVSDRPEGPFRDALGKPLIGEIHNGAQPIDQMVFKDDDGQLYMYYGGWKHANVVRLAPDLLSLLPFPDGVTYKEITPDPAYVEGSFMAKRKGVYYLMWSEGEWTGPDYRVAYAMGASPVGPFRRIGTILEQDARIARGAGHHSIVNIPGSDDWYIAYHRRPLNDKDGNHRELAIDRLYFNEDGTIRPVTMTSEGVPPRPLKGSAP
ncbi:glycoside hydrolase family 43 protein [Massilia norwichensis]|uniref:Glycoside hydrolase family 43 protein n=1 Tax=Massilia norwichensis TaxID=1442366 RepID=A0ABT2A5Y9_9BURK|nr:glycoside hydrolase family 43 protein [Massilia norwichensis]MCS0589510.1 glycoside hydrolase family 43 protein [Massilia norwichensis]